MNYFTWTPLELAANFFTVVCIVLAGRNNIHTWWTGIVGCILFGIMFYNVKLYADATLQVFFMVTGMYGWLMWKQHPILSRTDHGFVDPDGTIVSSNTQYFEGDGLEISNASKYYIQSGIAIAVTVAIGYGWLLHSFTDAYAPWIDSLVLSLSVLAQVLLMNRNIQTWQVWVLVNTLSVPLFWSRELYLTSVLYGFFWFNAVYSYFNWKKLMK